MPDGGLSVRDWSVNTTLIVTMNHSGYMFKISPRREAGSASILGVEVRRGILVKLDNKMQLFAKILLHKRIRSSPYTRVQWDANLDNIRSYDMKRLQKVVYQSKKQGTCDYCGEIGKNLTREHLLPKSYGGCCVIIRVCRRCNEQRGNSPRYVDFLRYIRRHPSVWKEAKSRACPKDAKKYGRFLNEVKSHLQAQEGSLFL